MDAIATRYLRFARREAHQRSPLYETLALHVAQSPKTLAFLDSVPRDRQQPNLLFAALRLVAGTPASTGEFDASLREHADAIAEVMMSRTTQTNEPARCATLLPALGKIEEPMALIEVGASAGLCLLMDRYGYNWGHGRLDAPLQGSVVAPVFDCKTSTNILLPSRYPEIVWRAGLDLNPLDVSSDDDVAWLEHLVWPEHHDRLQRLKGAIQIARKDPPRLVAGDLLKDLPALIAEAPSDATVVVFHTAVLSYVANQADRDAFADSMIKSGVVWLSNEAPGIFPQLAAGIHPIREDMFLLSTNGYPLAWTGPHGQELNWL